MSAFFSQHVDMVSLRLLLLSFDRDGGRVKLMSLHLLQGVWITVLRSSTCTLYNIGIDLTGKSNDLNNTLGFRWVRRLQHATTFVWTLLRFGNKRGCVVRFWTARTYLLGWMGFKPHFSRRFSVSLGLEHPTAESWLAGAQRGHSAMAKPNCKHLPQLTWEAWNSFSWEIGVI